MNQNACEHNRPCQSHLRSGINLSSDERILQTSNFFLFYGLLVISPSFFSVPLNKSSPIQSFVKYLNWLHSKLGRYPHCLCLCDPGEWKRQRHRSFIKTKEFELRNLTTLLVMVCRGPLTKKIIKKVISLTVSSAWRYWRGPPLLYGCMNVRLLTNWGQDTVRVIKVKVLGGCTFLPSGSS